jgi:hypothetical protein
LPLKYKRRHHYQYLTGLALKLLKKQISDEDILTQLLPTLPSEAHKVPWKQLDEVNTRCEPQSIKKKAATIKYSGKTILFHNYPEPTLFRSANNRFIQGAPSFNESLVI